MKHYWGLPVVDRTVLRKLIQDESSLTKEVASIPVKDRATRLTLQSLSDELLYVEGLAVDETEDDSDELSLFFWEDGDSEE